MQYAPPPVTGETSIPVGHAQMPAMQLPVEQSALAVHFCPGGHLFPHALPQSMSLSMPFFTPSLQLCCMHTLDVQTRSTHSLAVEHPLPATHGEQRPPQSVSVSF